MQKDGYIFSDNTKRCCCCKRILPATSEYFYKRTRKTKISLQSICIQCQREQIKKYRKENKDVISIKQKEYWIKNEAEIKENRKKHYEKNKEKLKEYSRNYTKMYSEIIKIKRKKYTETNKLRQRKRRVEMTTKEKEYELSVHRIYYKANKEKILNWNKEYLKNYYKNNKEMYKKYWNKRRTLKKMLPNDFTIEQWKKCKQYFDYKCAYCGKESKLTQDHFIPLSKGGEYTINNIVCACVSCNASKQDRNFFDWYPMQEHYSKSRERKILNYLHYNPKTRYQQLIISL
jgi:5-methylcytosine-specific restriction endonuclease McrA